MDYDLILAHLMEIVNRQRDYALWMADQEMRNARGEIERTPKGRALMKKLDADWRRENTSAVKSLGAKEILYDEYRLRCSVNTVAFKLRVAGWLRELCHVEGPAPTEVAA